MNDSTRKEFLLNELQKIHESGPIIGEDEARREFFIQEELSKTQSSGIGEILAEIVCLIGDDGYREDCGDVS